MLATNKLPTSKQTSQESQRSDVPEWLYEDQADGVHPTFKYGLKSNDKYPAVPKYPVKRRLAEEIARKLEALASRYPELVREGVDAYASRVRANNWMMLTPRSDERLLRSWMKLVSKLEIERLDFQYIGFTIAKKKGDLKEQFERIGIDSPTNLRWVKASNQKNLRALRNLAVDVAYKSHGCGAVFRYVIAKAAIAQPWPIVAAGGIQVSPKLETASDISEDQNVLCSECHAPMLTCLPKRVGDECDGGSLSPNGRLLRYLYMHVTLDKSRHVWCCHFLEGGSKVSLLGFRTFPNVTSVLEFTDYWKVDPKFLGEQMTLEGGVWLEFNEELYRKIDCLIVVRNSCLKIKGHSMQG